jgi:hypothetical protein
MSQGEITFTRAKLERLKKAYDRARLKGEHQFMFEGKALLTNYAKYLIEYLEGVIK